MHSFACILLHACFCTYASSLPCAVIAGVAQVAIKSQQPGSACGGRRRRWQNLMQATTAAAAAAAGRT